MDVYNTCLSYDRKTTIHSHTDTWRPFHYQPFLHRHVPARISGHRPGPGYKHFRCTIIADQLLYRNSRRTAVVWSAARQIREEEATLCRTWGLHHCLIG